MKSKSFKLAHVSSILVLLSAIDCSAKSLADYGIRNEAIEEFLSDYGLDRESDLEAFVHSDEVGKASGFYRNAWGQIKRSRDKNEIRKLTEVFVTGIDTKTKSNVLNRVWQPPFRERYFTETAKATLLDAENPNAFKADYIRALGLAGVDHPDIDLESYVRGKTTEESFDLPPIMQRGPYSHRFKTSAWAARVVLARRGDPEALEGLLEIVGEQTDMQLRALSEVILDLGYVAQPETVAILEEILFSDLGTPSNPYPDEIQNHWSAKPYAYMAIKPLAIAFEDFPVDYWKSGFYKPDLQLARNYMRKRGKSAEKKAESREIEPEPPTIEKPVKVTKTPSREETSASDGIPEESSRWWLWLLGALVVVGGLFAIIRRKQ